MRIVHLINSLDYGGAEQVVASLAATQARAGHSIWLVCLRDKGPHPVNIVPMVEAGVQIITLEKPEGLHLGTLRKLATFLATKRIEVIHTHNHLVHHYGAVAARLAKVPAIVNTLHGTSTLKMPVPAKMLYWFSCMLSDRVVSVCAQVHAVFKREYRLPTRILWTVDNGIELSPFLAIKRRAPSEITTFGMIGRFDPVKDHECLIRAFTILKAKHPTIRLRLLGDGYLRSTLESLARKLGVVEDIHFVGFSLDTAQFLSEIDIYVISSRSEGLPLTLLEAMGSGLPIVATAVGGIPEIIGKANCGWLCKPDNPVGLAGAMEEALEAPNRPAIGLCSRHAAEMHYSVSRMGREYESLYRQILLQRGYATVE